MRVINSEFYINIPVPIMYMSQTIDNLFEELKDMRIIGERLSGEPEILHEIEDYFRQCEFYPIIRNQIRRILEYVPSVFPEGWKSPDDYAHLTPAQQDAYIDIAKQGSIAIPGPVIEKVVALGLTYKARKH